MPPDLDSLYRDVLTDIENGDHREFAARALQIIVGAIRPLSFDEIRYAIAIESGHRILKDVEMNSQPDPERTLRGVLGALINIHNSRVDLVHQSAKDFLIRYYSGPNDQRDSIFSFEETVSNSLSFSCIAFLSLDDFAERSLVDENLKGLQELPGMQEYLTSVSSSSQSSENQALTATRDGIPAFFEYASLNWAKHFARCRRIASQTLIESAVTLSERNTARLENWSEEFRRSSKNWVTLPPNLNPFLVGAYFNHLHLIQHLLTQHVDESSLLMADEALTWAARLGHYDIVNTFLGFDIKLGGANVDGSRPLCWASRNGHAKVVSLLLTKIGSAQINSQDSEGRTPLSLAVGNGHLAVTEMLLASPKIIVDISNSRGWTPLFWAVGKDLDKPGISLGSWY